MGFKAFFGSLIGVLKKAWDLAEKAGLDDNIIQFALKYVRTAQTKYLDNNERREWVVRALVDHKVPEGVARLATELAVKLLKDELAKVGV